MIPLPAIQLETHQLRVTATCKTTNIIYVIECQRCGKQYVGETEQALHERVNSHRSEVLDAGPVLVVQALCKNPAAAAASLLMLSCLFVTFFLWLHSVDGALDQNFSLSRLLSHA